MALLQRIGEQGKTLRRGTQYPHIAIAQDVANLIRLEQWIEGYKDTTGSRSAETGDHGLEALLQVDGDALAALEPKGQQTASKPGNGFMQFAVSDGGLGIGECEGFRRSFCRYRDQVADKAYGLMSIFSILTSRCNSADNCLTSSHFINGGPAR
jgi:hypothetical protein